MSGLLLLAPLLVAQAQAAGVDSERSAWQYRRAVTAPAGASLASVVLPPELSAKAAPGGRDLRLVDETGREVPYLLDWTSEREGLATWQIAISDVRREQEEAREDSAIRSRWTLDLGEPRTFTDLGLRLPDVSFAWHVRVEASIDGKDFAVANLDAALFDQTWNNERVRRTNIRFDAPITARFLRLTARSAAGSRALEIEGATVTLRRRLKGDAWAMDVAATPQAGPDAADADRTQTTRYALAASSLLPFDEVEILSDDAAFSRRVRLVEEEGAGRGSATVLGQGTVFRVRAGDSLVAGETVRFPARSGHGGALRLEIDDAGSPPLRGLRVRLHGSRVRLLFPVSEERLTLYYGNPATRAPSYDLEPLRPRLTQAIGAGAAALANEMTNPEFRREPPLRFAATLGAALDASAWGRIRNILPLPEEDVYALTLSADDLAFLRSDLADVRVVNAEDRQVPFLIDPGFAEERIPLKVLRTDPPPKPSVYRLRPAGSLAGAQGEGPRLSRLELDVADAFFERTARLILAGKETRREPPFSMALSRKPPAVDPIVLGVSVPLGEMRLEVDDGDNAALDIRSAHAIVRVPRIVFKAAPGSLRLLLGNRAATAPRYDIAGLRGELLAYSAITARAGDMTENRNARRDWRGLLDAAPGSALVWGAILLALVVLVGLTVRTIRSA